METDKSQELEVAHLQRVVVDNAATIENTLNAAVSSGQLAGIHQIPAGSGYAEIENTLRAALLEKLESRWAELFPQQPNTENYDFGFFIAPSILNFGMKIPFAALQIKMDLSNWGIPETAGTPENIVNSIMMNLILKSSIVATAHGTQAHEADVMLGWVCATITGQAGSDKGNVHLIGYVFAAEMIAIK